MIFEELYKIMQSAEAKQLNMSLADCHIKGCFSLVVGGNENGNLTRVFIATKKIKPFDIQFHSHRYDLKIGVIHGTFTHHVALKDIAQSRYEGVNIYLKSFKYKSPLNGGKGLSEIGCDIWKTKTYNVPIGGEMYLPSDLIHSVSCSKGSIWVVQEQGFNCDSSVVLGTSFVTDGLYNEPKQYQINDMFQIVLNKLKLLVNP